MGGWFLSYAIPNFVAGKIATLTGMEEGQAGDTAASFENYISVFSDIGIVLIIIAVIVALATKPLNKLMHGVR